MIKSTEDILEERITNLEDKVELIKITIEHIMTILKRAKRDSKI